MSFRPIASGTVTSPKGFRAGTTYSGLKKPGDGVLDLGILVASGLCTAVGVFTKNLVVASPVVLSRNHLASGSARAIVVNSGIANAAVGEQGMIDAQEMARLTAEKIGAETDEVLVCSTGVIGVELPMGVVQKGIENIALPSAEGGHELARAMMTTDTKPKEVAVTVEVDGHEVTVGGVCKGAAMIHPDMATMLAFLTTDASVAPECMSRMLKTAVDVSFNMITIDGDTSTNDSVLFLASGEAVGPEISGGAPESVLQEAVTTVCTTLAKAIAADGEGSTTLVEVVIEGARTFEDARKAARTVAGSTLLKAAVYGRDPNWGRAIAALGRSGVDIDPTKLALWVNEICVLDEGKPIPFFKEAAVATMREPEVRFLTKLGLGNATATAWTCDLTEEYVRLNSDYTT
ncbi:MAG: bifunctional glutamate N-acetyltransferase/amino-acid acetyltransferase ArgJ [Dehalococcoidia bacterium]|jgi:glutamate N-acetyltransferase/amino-acid N-acetyltransferase|nr:bifunctional glutamate N-acetyltransferase/amino-acid acetyltransferase ArgJ [Dehalococcoidia bacterium]